MDSAQRRSSISCPTLAHHYRANNHVDFSFPNRMVLEAKSISYGTLSDPSKTPPLTHTALLQLTQYAIYLGLQSLNKMLYYHYRSG